MHDPRQARQRSTMRVRKYRLGAEPLASVLKDLGDLEALGERVDD